MTVLARVVFQVQRSNAKVQSISEETALSRKDKHVSDTNCISARCFRDLRKPSLERASDGSSNPCFWCPTWPKIVMALFVRL